MLFLPTAYAGLSRLLSMPKPVELEWWHANAEEAIVLASTFREDEAIYLWLQLRDLAEPRAYTLPWNRDLAEQLHRRQRSAEAAPTLHPASAPAPARTRTPWPPSATRDRAS